MSTGGRKRGTRARCAALAATLALALAGTAGAAPSAPRWGTVTTLWETDSISTYPDVAADPFGRVHVVWQERVFAPDAASTVGDAIYHRVWDGATWSDPGIVLRAPRGTTSISHARVLASPGGTLYLFWLDRQGLYFTRAAAVDAANPNAWQEPRRIGETPLALDLDVQLRGEDHLYAAFTDIAPQAGPAPLLFVRSTDGGATWSQQEAVLGWQPGQQSVAAQPSLAVDAAGTVHIVWDERSGPHWLGDRILYAQRAASAGGWTPPLVLDDIAGEKDGSRVTIASLAATPDGDLHATWACGSPAGRCYRRRPAGGSEWTPIAHPFGGLVSVAGWDPLLVDGEGTVHFVAQLRAPKGIYYAFKRAGESWSKPLLLDPTDSGADPHFPHATIAYGNQLFAVWQKQSQDADIAFASLRTTAQPQPPRPLPPRPKPRPNVPLRVALLLGGIAVAALWLLRRRARRA